MDLHISADYQWKDLREFSFSILKHKKLNDLEKEWEGNFSFSAPADGFVLF